MDSIDSLNVNLSSFIKEKNLQIDNETKKLLNPLENLDTPFGKILINFTYLLIIFPLGIGVGFFIVLFKLRGGLMISIQRTPILARAGISILGSNPLLCGIHK